MGMFDYILLVRTSRLFIFFIGRKSVWDCIVAQLDKCSTLSQLTCLRDYEASHALHSTAASKHQP